MRACFAVLALALSAAPASRGSRPVGADTITSSFSVDGIPVILRRNTSSNVVVANVYLLGGTRQVTRTNAGIEPFLLSVSEHGTVHYPKAVLRRKTAQIGSDFVIAPTQDWTMFGARTITQVVDSAWAIFADRLMNPSFDPAEVELVRTQLVAAVAQEATIPTRTSRARGQHRFRGTSLFDSGERRRALDSVDNGCAAREYQQAQIVKSRMLISWSATCTRAHVESLIHATIGKLPAGNRTSGHFRRSGSIDRRPPPRSCHATCRRTTCSVTTPGHSLLRRITRRCESRRPC